MSVSLVEAMLTSQEACNATKTIAFKILKNLLREKQERIKQKQMMITTQTTTTQNSGTKMT